MRMTDAQISVAFAEIREQIDRCQYFNVQYRLARIQTEIVTRAQEVCADLAKRTNGGGS